MTEGAGEAGGGAARAVLVAAGVAAAYMLLVLALMLYCRRRRRSRRQRGSWPIQLAVDTRGYDAISHIKTEGTGEWEERAVAAEVAVVSWCWLSCCTAARGVDSSGHTACSQHSQL